MTKANHGLMNLDLLALWVSFLACAAFSQFSFAADEVRYGAELTGLPSIRFPKSPSVVNIKEPPYSAKGNGVADDSDAIQKALDDNMGEAHVLYFPAGTYVITRTLKWSKKNAKGIDAWGKNWIQGENVATTRILLRAKTFDDPASPQSMMWCGGFGSADWFHNYIQDLTFDIGDENRGAVALQFYSNNSGAVRNCRFVDKANVGLIGLDLGHRDMNGPLLVKNCEVVGFDCGIKTSHAVNGQVFEDITLRGQRKFGFDNEGQSISLCSIDSENAVPAIRSYGNLCVINSRLKGTGSAKSVPAIIGYNGGQLYVREVDTHGYSRGVADVATPDWSAALREPDGANIVANGKATLRTDGAKIAEYSTSLPNSAFPVTKDRAMVPFRRSPKVAIDAPNEWANVDDFGADPSGQKDSAIAIQKAIDSGASTIFFPGNYAVESTIVVRGRANHFIGVGAWIDYTAKAKPDFRIEDGDRSTVVFEHFSFVHGGIEIATNRAIFMKSVSDCDLTSTVAAQGGELYFEDFVTHNLRLKDQSVWARQLNVENEGLHIECDGGELWILGYKTERGGTLIRAASDAKVEVLGGFSYTTTAGKLGPMFDIDGASVFTFFAEVCYNNDPFEVLVRERRNEETRELKRGSAHLQPYRSQSK